MRTIGRSAASVAGGVAGVVAVMLLASWHDIPGSTALIAVLALTGTSGAQAVAAVHDPAGVVRELAEAGKDVSGPRGGV
jgi:hypothetical protein